jgi:subtilisin family serine protease
VSKYGIDPAKITHVYGSALRGFALSGISEQELQSLRREKSLAYIEQDQQITVAMGGPPGGGGGGGGGQTIPWGVARVGGPQDGTNAGTAWIIDSGIDLDHPDLNVDVSRSISFLTGGGGNTSPEDQNGHGTHVAGIVGAIDNSIGVVGTAAGATLVAVRVLDRRGSGSYSGVIAGVDYVKANAASGDAANMSLGGPPSTALDDAVKAASNVCPFAIAAGNESDHAGNYSPARANGPNIYTVSSMAQGDVWSYFSNYGNPPVDYCAPGSSIYSTYKNGGYTTLSGTSMAAPHVCGILLIGGITTDGFVSGDPDGNADPIAHH